MELKIRFLHPEANSPAKMCHIVYIYYNALGVLHRRTYLPSAFHTTRLSLPSAFRTEGLLCLRLFARQDFPLWLGHFCYPPLCNVVQYDVTIAI